MAKVAAGRKTRSRTASLGALFGDSAVAREAAGVLLLGVVAIAALGLWSFEPRDALFRWVAVENAGGVAGANLAGQLVRFAGVAAWGIVLALAAIAAQLLTAGRLVVPRQFWIAAGVSFAAIAALPQLLATLAPDRFASLSGGWLGASLRASSLRC